MRTVRIQHQSEIAAEPAELFEFHANPENARHILPPTTMGFRMLEGGRAAPGATFCIAAREWGIFPMAWTGRWVEIESPRLLADESVASPFTIWLHRHEFIKTEQGAILKDTVDVMFGKGWVGWLITTTGVRV